MSGQFEIQYTMRGGDWHTWEKMQAFENACDACKAARKLAYGYVLVFRVVNKENGISVTLSKR